MRDLVFLPDREGRDELTAATGFVRCGTDASALRGLADRLVVRAEEARRDDAAWRGTLALALLLDTWPGEQTKLQLLEVDASVSPFAAWVLAARAADRRRDGAMQGHDGIRLVLLERDGERKLLGLADAHEGVTLPAAPGDLRGMMPERARWFDPESGKMTDPIYHLSETEREVLCRRMEAMQLDAPHAIAFLHELQEVDAAEREALELGREDELDSLSKRMLAVCGMAGFEGFSVREEICDASGVNPLAEVLGGKIPLSVGDGHDATYLWNDIPFARTSRYAGLTGTGADGEVAMVQIGTELQMISAQSVRWNADTARKLADWLEARREAPLYAAVREHLVQLRRTVAEQGRQIQTAVTLEWPWDASQAVKLLLQEALGEGWMRAAQNPFSDRLTKLTNQVLGDTALQTCCACADGVLLPPLSKEMAECVARAEEGAGLAMDALRFQPREDGGITASFLLRGMGEVRMMRTYGIEDMLVLDEEDCPRVAVWPCLPMEQWRAYHVFLKGGGVQTEALCSGAWKPLQPGADEWRCLRTETYPACIVVMKDELCLGALPNMLPAFRAAAEKDAAASIDLGSMTTAAVLSMDGQTIPAQGHPLTRVLTGAPAAGTDDFLSGLTGRGVSPTAVELVGDGEGLFTDGYMYRASSFDTLAAKDPSSLLTLLKWRSAPAFVRARKLLLHQVMLNVSLAAVMNGARSIRWRMTVADEMDEEGRAELLDMAETLAGEVALETGLPLTGGADSVAWAEEAAALQAYLRGEGGCRGSFVSLDLGGASTKMHLWMQGKDTPAAGAVLFDGVQKQLAGALIKRPELLQSDFADCMDAGMKAAADALYEQLLKAPDSLQEADKATLMLTTLMDEYRQPLTQHLAMRLAQQRPAYLQAILLEMLAAAMYNVGLMLAQAGEDTMTNHYLPEDMTVCLTGRGAWLLDTMPPAMRNNLQHLCRGVLRLDHPVRFVTLRTAPQPELATALGMAALRTTGRTVDVPLIRTDRSFSQMMCDLMVRTAAAFPAHQWLLHEGMFDQWGSMTQAAEELIRNTASVSYGDGKDIPGSVFDFVRRMRMTAVPAEDAP